MLLDSVLFLPLLDLSFFWLVFLWGCVEVSCVLGRRPRDTTRSLYIALSLLTSSVVLSPGTDRRAPLCSTLLSPTRSDQNLISSEQFLSGSDQILTGSDQNLSNSEQNQKEIFFFQFYINLNTKKETILIWK